MAPQDITPDGSTDLLDDLVSGLPDEWHPEREGDVCARAYSHDVTENPPKEEVVSINARTDTTEDGMVYVFSVAWNERRGMGDLHDSRTVARENVSQAAAELAASVLDDTREVAQ
jgi:hypothetical protein